MIESITAKEALAGLHRIRREGVRILREFHGLSVKDSLPNTVGLATHRGAQLQAIGELTSAPGHAKYTALLEGFAGWKQELINFISCLPWTKDIGISRASDRLHAEEWMFLSRFGEQAPSMSIHVPKTLHDFSPRDIGGLHGLERAVFSVLSL